MYVEAEEKNKMDLLITANALKKHIKRKLMKDFDTTLINLQDELKDFDTTLINLQDELKDFDTTLINLQDELKDFDTTLINLQDELKGSWICFILFSVLILHVYRTFKKEFKKCWHRWFWIGQISLVLLF